MIYISCANEAPTLSRSAVDTSEIGIPISNNFLTISTALIQQQNSRSSAIKGLISLTATATAKSPRRFCGPSRNPFSYAMYPLKLKNSQTFIRFVEVAKQLKT